MVPLVIVLLQICGKTCEGSSDFYDSKKKLCYRFSLSRTRPLPLLWSLHTPAQDKSSFRLFGILSKKRDLQIDEVYPFNSATLPNAGLFGSLKSFDQFMAFNKNLINRQVHFLHNQQLPTVNDDSLPFFEISDMDNADINKIVAKERLPLRCEQSRHGPCGTAFSCMIEFPPRFVPRGMDDEQRLNGQPTFLIPKKERHCTIYLKRLDVKYVPENADDERLLGEEGVFMYVAYSTRAFGDESVQSLPSDLINPTVISSYIKRCTMDVKCHPFLLDSVRSSSANYGDRCDHSKENKLGCCRISGNPFGECELLSRAMLYKVFEVYFHKGKSNSWARADALSGEEVFSFLTGEHGVVELYQDLIAKGKDENGGDLVGLKICNDINFFDFMVYLRAGNTQWLQTGSFDQFSYHEQDARICYPLTSVLPKIRNRMEAAMRQLHCRGNEVKAMIIGFGEPCITSTKSVDTKSPWNLDQKWLPVSDVFDKAAALAGMPTVNTAFYANHYVMLVAFPDGSVIGYNNGDVGLVYYTSFAEFWEIHSKERLYEETVLHDRGDKFFFGSSFVGSVDSYFRESFEHPGRSPEEILKLKDKYMSHKQRALQILADGRVQYAQKLGEPLSYGYVKADYSTIELVCSDFRGFMKRDALQSLPYVKA